MIVRIENIPNNSLNLHNTKIKSKNENFEKCDKIKTLNQQIRKNQKKAKKKGIFLLKKNVGMIFKRIVLNI